MEDRKSTLVSSKVIYLKNLTPKDFIKKLNY